MASSLFDTASLFPADSKHSLLLKSCMSVMLVGSESHSAQTTAMKLHKSHKSRTSSSSTTRPQGLGHGSRRRRRQIKPARSPSSSANLLSARARYRTGTQEVDVDDLCRALAKWQIIPSWKRAYIQTHSKLSRREDPNPFLSPPANGRDHGLTDIRDAIHPPPSHHESLAPLMPSTASAHTRDWRGKLDKMTTRVPLRPRAASVGHLHTSTSDASPANNNRRNSMPIESLRGSFLTNYAAAANYGSRSANKDHGRITKPGFQSGSQSSRACNRQQSPTSSNHPQVFPTKSLRKPGFASVPKPAPPTGISEEYEDPDPTDKIRNQQYRAQLQSLRNPDYLRFVSARLNGKGRAEIAATLAHQTAKLHAQRVAFSNTDLSKYSWKPSAFDEAGSCQSHVDARSSDKADHFPRSPSQKQTSQQDHQKVRRTDHAPKGILKRRTLGPDLVPTASNAPQPTMGRAQPTFRTTDTLQPHHNNAYDLRARRNFKSRYTVTPHGIVMEKQDVPVCETNAPAPAKIVRFIEPFIRHF